MEQNEKGSESTPDQIKSRLATLRRAEQISYQLEIGCRGCVAASTRGFSRSMKYSYYVFKNISFQYFDSFHINNILLSLQHQMSSFYTFFLLINPYIIVFHQMSNGSQSLSISCFSGERVSQFPVSLLYILLSFVVQFFKHNVHACFLSVLF